MGDISDQKTSSEGGGIERISLQERTRAIPRLSEQPGWIRFGSFWLLAGLCGILGILILGMVFHAMGPNVKKLAPYLEEERQGSVLEVYERMNQQRVDSMKELFNSVIRNSLVPIIFAVLGFVLRDIVVRRE